MPWRNKRFTERTTLLTIHFMKRSLLLSLTAACLAATTSLASDQPRGSLIELHSCELYAGGCTVSSEATGDGRYLLRAWNFTSGSFDGTALAGLHAAVLQSSSQNLADRETVASESVVYLPSSATKAQREALVAWLKSSQPDLKYAKLQSRVVPMAFTKTETGYTFSAGEFARVSTASLESCDRGSCGEALWYNPRSTTSLFTVAVDRASSVFEPLLKLKWNDAGKRSVFIGKFDGGEKARSAYVTAADLCGPAEKLF
jgi:hypothetical protein